MKTPIIWKKLIIGKRRMTTSAEIRKLSRRVGKDGQRSLRYLQEHGYICRVLRGIFYVKSPEEREREFFELSVYEMVSKALGMKGVKDWYFGLETALKLNNMTQEYFTVDFVITDSYRTTKVIDLLGKRFQFLRRAEKHFKFGILRKKGLRYSDREKTVLDMVYWRFQKDRDAEETISPLHEYGEPLDRELMRSYLVNYPRGFRETVLRHL
jgi:predicted transcriptional regulator of viral defense system